MRDFNSDLRYNDNSYVRELDAAADDTYDMTMPLDETVYSRKLSRLVLLLFVSFFVGISAYLEESQYHPKVAAGMRNANSMLRYNDEPSGYNPASDGIAVDRADEMNMDLDDDEAVNTLRQHSWAGWNHG
ncbi:uncharacterized protein LOC133530940 [Cydia pomonella]|uniref:uncharacterized protein LOC133530940 n=1 Tax=Cydia pomonella TaxID=82600 RepID=UPI002ADD65BC|nr:uncharacterized protein LOC133530940 [Cydia pomonella]